MIVEGALSRQRQEAGRLNYNLFNVVNGCSYMCLGETIIILFALRLACPDYIIAALSSFIYLGHFAMPAGKYLSSKIGGAKSISLFWVMRNLAAMLVASAYFLRSNNTAAIALITVCTLVFYACRSAGMVAMQPLVGEITTDENRGRFISSSSLYFDLARLVCLGFILWVFVFSSSLVTLALIITAGSIFGFTSAFFLSRIDETSALMESARRPILGEFKKLFTMKIRFRQLLPNYIGSAAVALIVPVSVLILKEGYHISDNAALLFSLVQFAGAIGSYYLIGMVSNVAGPKPVMIISYLVLVLVCVYWIFAPTEFLWYYAAIPFLAIGASAAGLTVTLMQYFLRTIPNTERVGASLAMYVVSGISAAVTSILIGGTLLKKLPHLPYAEFADTISRSSHFSMFGTFAQQFVDPATAPLRIYQLYMLVIFVVAIACLPFFMRLRSFSHFGVRSVLGLAFAPRDMSALYTLYRIKETPTEAEEERDIEKLGSSRSPISEKALLDALDSPKLAVRSRALLALSGLPLSENGRKAVLHELEYCEHTTANIAAQICGNHGITEAIPIMRRQILETADYYLKSKAMLALAQLHDRSVYPAIEDIFMRSENPRLLIHGAAALAETGEASYALSILRRTAAGDLPEYVVSELMCSFAELGSFGDAFYRFARLFHRDQVTATANLADAVFGSSAEAFSKNLSALVDGREKASVAVRGAMSEAEKTQLRMFGGELLVFLRGNQISFDTLNVLVAYACICALGARKRGEPS